MSLSHGFIIGVDIEVTRVSEEVARFDEITGKPYKKEIFDGSKIAKIKETNILIDYGDLVSGVIQIDLPSINETGYLYEYEYTTGCYCCGLICPAYKRRSISVTVIQDVQSFFQCKFDYSGMLNIYSYIS
jgi:hypothetical protein